MVISLGEGKLLLRTSLERVGLRQAYPGNTAATAAAINVVPLQLSGVTGLIIREETQRLV